MIDQTLINDTDVIDGLYIKYMKVFGFWRIINEYRTERKKKAINILALMSICIISPFYVCQYLVYFFSSVDLEKITFLNMHTLPALQLLIKTSIFFFRLDSLSRLFSLLRKDFMNIPREKHAEASSIYKKVTKETNALCYAALISNTSIVIMSIIIPGISVDYIEGRAKSMLEVTGGRFKILGGWYPLPLGETPYYEIVLVYEIITISWAGLFLAAYISMYYQVLMSLYTQTRVLAYHVSTFKVEENMTDGQLINNDPRLRQDLHFIIKDHQRLIQYAEELKRVYNPLSTMILGTSTGILVISVFQFLFGGRGSPMLVFKSLHYLSFQAIEATMVCYGSSCIESAVLVGISSCSLLDGTRMTLMRKIGVYNLDEHEYPRLVESKSTDLNFAAYSSGWYKANPKFRRDLQMMILRAKKGMTLTAVRTYPVNLETLMNIFQFTYTVAALISRMTE